MEGYRAWLLGSGYSPLSVTHSLVALGHLDRWMERYDVNVAQLTNDVSRAFLVDHVDDHGHLPTAGVRPLLEYLRSEGVVPLEPARRRSALDFFLDEYRGWLAVERALSPETVRGYTRLACRFLAERVSVEDQLGARCLTGADVTGFLLRESMRVRPGSVCCHANQLRQLLRYLGMRGYADPALAAAVPSVGRWREAAIPQFPARPAIERLLESCDRSRTVGVRDYAILMLLARLGLRTIEVCRLELDDLHWRAGEIEIDGKGHERARLPLLGDVGEALVAYLTLRGRRTRNLRLTAIRSLFSYAAVRHPEHAAVIGRVLSIPPKRFQRRAVTFLTAEESEALIDAPPQDRWEGRRDRTMLTLTIQAGLRVSELVAVNCGDVTLGTGGCVRVVGKGRKHRAVPLTQEARAVLTVWITERDGMPEDPLFPTRTGRRLSRDAVERRVATHVATATKRCASLKGKRVHPHVLRHSCAMALLQAGVDSTVIALWLGHADVRSTQPYIHADMTIKERALALVAPASVKPGRYTPGDDLLAFLDSLG